MSDPYLIIYIQQENALENSVKRLYELVFTNQEFINILMNMLKKCNKYDYANNDCHHPGISICSLCKWFTNHVDENNNVKEILDANPNSINQMMKKFNDKYNSILKICVNEKNRLQFELSNDTQNLSDLYIKLETYKIVNNVMKPISKDIVIDTLQKSCYIVSVDIISPLDTVPFYNIRMKTLNPDKIISDYGRQFTMSKTSFC